MDLKELVCEDVNKIHLAQDRMQQRTVVNTVAKRGEFLY
jgi:hypothetical protein